MIDARARAEQRGKQHWITAFPHVEAWILAKPVSTSASEISSQAGEGDFDDETLADTPKQHEVEVLVVQTQNGANMATSSTTTAAGTTITARSTAASTAALQVAGPSTKEPIVEQLGQDTPSVIQGAHPEQRYGSQPYFSGQWYTTRTPLKALEKPRVIFEGIKTKVINNEGVLPPQVSPVGGRLSNFVEGWKRITNDPYVLTCRNKSRLCSNRT